MNSRTRRNGVLVALYMAFTALANLLVTWFGPGITPFSAFALIGFDLSSRDALHEAWRGQHLRRNMLALIGSGSVLSAVLNWAAAPIAVASFASFFASGLVDTLVYSALDELPRRQRMYLSNVASAAVDSVLFPTLAFGVFMPEIVVAQFLAKVAGGTFWAWMLTRRSAVDLVEAV